MQPTSIAKMLLDVDIEQEILETKLQNTSSKWIVASISKHSIPKNPDSSPADLRLVMSKPNPIRNSDVDQPSFPKGWFPESGTAQTEQRSTSRGKVPTTGPKVRWLLHPPQPVEHNTDPCLASEAQIESGKEYSCEGGTNLLDSLASKELSASELAQLAAASSISGKDASPPD